MSQVKILLVDFDPTGILCPALEAILNSSPAPKPEVRRDTPRGPGPFGNLRLELSRPNWDPQVIFAILQSGPDGRAVEIVQAVRQAAGETPFIVVGEMGQADDVLLALNHGAADFITPPLRPVDILPRLWRTLEHIKRRETLTQSLKERIGLKQLIGQSPSFLAETKKIPLVANCDSSVLISGETGTGKELCARAIHYLSPRSAGPLVPVNCGALPFDLVENELFGHDRGAFTGAATSQVGLIQEAHGGTLFLDEIDCLPALAQVKLLRFLQDKEYRPLGSARARRADVRVLASTNVDLDAAVRDGKIRQDLFYRLNVIPLALPPLRERSGDIPLLARHFLESYAIEFSRTLSGFSSGAMRRLMSHHWPGNVRELQHVIERAVALSEGPVLHAEDISLPQVVTAPSAESFQRAKAQVIEQFEKNFIQGLLISHKGNITRAAEAAGKNRRAFWQLIRKHRINVQSFKSDPS